MPPRDEQDFAHRRQQIIDGALDVFSRKGFEKATNREIAEAAGIGSPGLIYHYFKDKADLLRNVLEEHAPLVRLTARPDALMDLPPREALLLFGRTIFGVLEKPGPSFFKLLLGEALRQPTVADIVSQIGPGRGIALMSRYLESQMDAGVLRRVDPAVATRCFIGPLIAYIMTRAIFPQPDVQTLTPEAMLTTTVDLFLRGMQPEERA